MSNQLKIIKDLKAELEQTQKGYSSIKNQLCEAWVKIDKLKAELEQSVSKGNSDNKPSQ